MHVAVAAFTCVLTNAFWRLNMQTFVYKQTQTHYLHVEAETQAQADAIADEVDVYADNVYTTELNGWELTEEEA